MITNIVILTRNRESLKRQAVDTLYRNTEQGSFNLTIIDDESIKLPVYPDIMHQRFDWTSLTIERSKGITGQARNLGVYWAEKYWGRGDYLYLSDDDLYFTPYWLQKLINHIEHTNITLIGGWNHPFLQPKADTLKASSSAYTASFDDMKFALHDAVAGASQLMRWETWDKYSPLDAHAPGVGQSEDWKFCQDIIKDGGRVGSIYPRVVLNCGITNSLSQPSPGADVMHEELVEAKKIYPDLYWE